MTNEFILLLLNFRQSFVIIMKKTPAEKRNFCEKYSYGVESNLQLSFPWILIRVEEINFSLAWIS